MLKTHPNAMTGQISITRYARNAESDPIDSLPSMTRKPPAYNVIIIEQPMMANMSGQRSDCIRARTRFFFR